MQNAREKCVASREREKIHSPSPSSCARANERAHANFTVRSSCADAAEGGATLRGRTTSSDDARPLSCCEVERAGRMPRMPRLERCRRRRSSPRGRRPRSTATRKPRVMPKKKEEQQHLLELLLSSSTTSPLDDEHGGSTAASPPAATAAAGSRCEVVYEAEYRRKPKRKRPTTSARRSHLDAQRTAEKRSGTPGGSSSLTLTLTQRARRAY
jgi:hypothetical protein